MRPDWWQYIEDYFVLQRLGVAALELFDFPRESERWRSAIKLLAVLEKQAEMLIQTIPWRGNKDDQQQGAY